MSLSLIRSLSCAALITLAATGASAEQGRPPVIGGAKDAHGCLVAAGYTYSRVKGQCIRLFEDGIRLDAKARRLSKSSSAFVVFKHQNGVGPAELFLPNSQGSVLLKKVRGVGAGAWRNRHYRLSQWKGMYSLDNARGQLLYQGAVSR